MTFSAPTDGLLIARVEKPGVGPCVATLRDGMVVDITSRDAPTVRDLCELASPAEFASAANGEVLGSIEVCIPGLWRG